MLVSPQGLLIVALSILAIGKICFNRDYLNCFGIVKNHLECFRMADGRISKVSFLLYFVAPLLLSLSLVRIRILDDTVTNIVTIIVSIFTSMFFTLLTLILDMHSKVEKDTKYNAGDAYLSIKLLKETYYSIMFEILISVLILMMCFIELFAKQYTNIGSIIIYYLTFILLINLFIILKRIYNIIKRDLEI